LDTDLQKGLSTARLIVTVRDAAGPLAGAFVSIDEEVSGVSCDEGCGQETDAGGQLTLTLSGVPTETATRIPVRVASVAGYDEVTVTAEVVGFSTVDLDIVLGATTNSLTIEGGGDGSGTVTSSPAGILCDINIASGSEDCQQQYPSGTQVTLTATPETGSSFGGWSGGCSGTSTSCTVTMDQARTVTAAFDEANTPEYPFRFSCTSIGGDDCENHYDNGSGCGAPTDTYSENKCPADGALGVCTVTFPDWGYVELVPYFSPGDTPVEIKCTDWLGGTWSDTYTGE
jgi:hypothetical protein